MTEFLSYHQAVIAVAVVIYAVIVFVFFFFWCRNAARDRAQEEQVILRRCALDLKEIMRQLEKLRASRQVHQAMATARKAEQTIQQLEGGRG